MVMDMVSSTITRKETGILVALGSPTIVRYIATVKVDRNLGLKMHELVG